MFVIECMYLYIYIYLSFGVKLLVAHPDLHANDGFLTHLLQKHRKENAKAHATPGDEVQAYYISTILNASLANRLLKI